MASRYLAYYSSARVPRLSVPVVAPSGYAVQASLGSCDPRVASQSLTGKSIVPLAETDLRCGQMKLHDLLAVLVWLPFCLLSEPADAQCRAPRATLTPFGLQPGPVVTARERDGPSPHWAHAGYDQDGWPVITHGPFFYALPPLMRRLTAIHECAHLALLTQNEFVANCEALRTMRSQGLTVAEENFIRDFHFSIRFLPPQYGGSGAALWQGTTNICGAR